jgi:two-component system sensor histidine kinase HydH
MAGQTVSFLEKKKALDLQKRNEKQALLGSMLSRVVHDMKNPLSGISGYAQLIKRKASEERLKSHCDTILEALESLNRMNADLLTYVRGEKPSLERSEVAIYRLLSKLVESTAESDRIAGITIKLDGESNALVWGDPDRLSRVFTNLLSNAREAMSEGGTVTISVEPKNPTVLIQVQDSGPGIPAHLRKRIFDPFVSHGKTNGTGLGLAIAKSIVEEHGGDISLHGRVGNGTIFKVVLPRHLQEEKKT